MVKQTRFSFLWEQQVFIIIRHEAGPGEPIFSLRRQAGVSCRPSSSFRPLLLWLGTATADVRLLLIWVCGEQGSSKSFPPFLDVGEAIESDDELPFLSPRAAQA